MRSALVLLITVLFVEIVNAQLEYDGESMMKMEGFVQLERLRRGGDRKKKSFTMKEKIRIIERHNDLRRKQNSSNMEMMIWSKLLEKVAQDWANACSFTLNPNRAKGQKKPVKVSEMKYATSNYISGRPEKFINYFYKEMNYYTYSTGACEKSKQCGHYTQIVWHDTAFVGCGVKFCRTLTFSTGKPDKNTIVVVCNYSPMGNWYGLKPYKKGDACSACPGHKKQCVKGLCSAENCGGMRCGNGEKLRTDICFCETINSKVPHILGHLYLLTTSVLFVLMHVEFNLLP